MNDIKKIYFTKKRPITNGQFVFHTSRQINKLQLGERLGLNLAHHFLKGNEKIRLTCTSREADNICRGVLNSLSSINIEPLLSIFWHKIVDVENIEVAPIVMKYEEKKDEACLVNIIICSKELSLSVLKTELIYLFEKGIPLKTIIVLPIEYKNIEYFISKEFPIAYSSTFYFYYLRKECTNNKSVFVTRSNCNLAKRIMVSQKGNINLSIPKIVAERTMSKSKAVQVDHCEIKNVLHNVKQFQKMNRTNANSKDSY